VVQNLATSYTNYRAGTGNVGLSVRQQFINFDIDGVAGGVTYSALLPQQSVQNLWKSYIFKKSNTTSGSLIGGLMEIAVTATIYLKHLHSFFASCPLVKGAFLKITLNLNNTSTVVQVGGDVDSTPDAMALVSVANPVGGVNPIMIASTGANQGGLKMGAKADGSVATYTATVQVGARCLNSSVTAFGAYADGPLAKSVYLYIPAYTFNPVFEEAYLSSPVKSIKYTDVYQYQVLNVTANAQFNNLLTNGIANLKSVLLLPYYSVSAGSANTGIPQGIPVYQSPFDPAGSCATSPLCLFSNFNVVISGQNVIYNTERYSFEQFNNQLYGQNAVNAGMTDGLTSGLINALGFEMEYCYWYVNVSRMLPVEESVPKSVQIIGTNQSAKAIDLFCFLEYGCEIAIDILTGTRV
jgi:hypothetical protein